MTSSEQNLQQQFLNVQRRRYQLAKQNRQLRRLYMAKGRHQLVKPSTVLGAGLLGACTYAILKRPSPGSSQARYAGQPESPWHGLLRESRLLAVDVIDRQVQRWLQLAWIRVKARRTEMECK